MMRSTDPMVEVALKLAFAAAADYPLALPPQGGLRPKVAPVPLEKMLFEMGVVDKEVADLTRTAAAAALPALRIARPDMLSDQTPLAGLLYVTPEGGCIMVRANDPIPRRRFSVAHELGHYLMHFPPESVVDDEVTDDEPATIGDDDGDEVDGAALALDERERQANQFAAELLMPEPIVRGLHEFYVERHGDTPRFVESHISGDLLVSRQAVRWRLADLKLASV